MFCNQRLKIEKCGSRIAYWLLSYINSSLKLIDYDLKIELGDANAPGVCIRGLTTLKLTLPMSSKDLISLSIFINALFLGLILLLSESTGDIDGRAPKTVISSHHQDLVPLLSSSSLSLDEETRPPPSPEIILEPLAPPPEEWYTLKSGDNPWKIAKAHKIKFDDLLKLNGLNEDRARNLKPGDQIRIR